MAVGFKAEKAGTAAELEACLYLQRQGLRFLQRNYRCRCGEIDLIMQDGEEIVFVEVRLRRQAYLGSAVESVTQAKQRKIIKAATLYLQEKKWWDRVDCRFDVLGINDRNQFEWIRNAFGLGFI